MAITGAALCLFFLTQVEWTTITKRNSRLNSAVPFLQNPFFLPYSNDTQYLPEPFNSSWEEDFAQTLRNQGYSFCQNVHKPGWDTINLRHDFWHFFQYDNMTVYLFRAYLDDREFVTEGSIIRVLPMLSTPKGLVPVCKQYYLLLWYNGQAQPVSSKCTCKSTNSIWFWEIEKQRYGFSSLECGVPQGAILPSHVSLMSNECCDEPHTFVPLNIPERLSEKPRDVGICVKAIFGTLTRQNLTYVISWFETLRIYGVPQVHMYYDPSLKMDNIVERAFQYYTDSKFLKFEKLPNALFETDKPYVNIRISQSVVHPSINDCFLRNLHKFAYIIHTDFDELLIPRKHISYKEMLNHFITQNPDTDNASGFISRSAYFYFDDDYVGNPSNPDYLPLLRYTHRMPVEYPKGEWKTWNTRGTGVQKSFHSTSMCKLIGIHRCFTYVLQKGNRTGIVSAELPADLVLSHHYRTSCKVYDRCVWEKYRRINDKILTKQIGPILQDRVKYVLDSIGYF